MTPEELKTYCDKYGVAAVAEATCKSVRALFYMIRGDKAITEATAKLVRMSFPDFEDKE